MSSRVHVGCIRIDGIFGTNTEPHTQPATRAPNLQAKQVQLGKYANQHPKQNTMWVRKLHHQSSYSVINLPNNESSSQALCFLI